MAGVKITVTFKNQAAANKYVGDILRKLSDPKVHKAVNRVGKYWQKNFKSEGGEVGGWAGLADQTVEDRLSQGYGAGPIMFRYGSLYRMSAAFFANTISSSTRSEGTPYDARAGHTTKASLKINKGVATLNISGPKVYNQWPSHKGRPARSFWPNNAAAHHEARQGMVDWIVEDVILGRSP